MIGMLQPQSAAVGAHTEGARLRQCHHRLWPGRQFRLDRESVRYRRNHRRLPRFACAATKCAIFRNRNLSLREISNACRSNHRRYAPRVSMRRVDVRFKIETHTIRVWRDEQYVGKYEPGDLSAVRGDEVARNHDGRYTLPHEIAERFARCDRGRQSKRLIWKVTASFCTSLGRGNHAAKRVSDKHNARKVSSGG